MRLTGWQSSLCSVTANATNIRCLVGPEDRAACPTGRVPSMVDGSCWSEHGNLYYSMPSDAECVDPSVALPWNISVAVDPTPSLNFTARVVPLPGQEEAIVQLHHDAIVYYAVKAAAADGIALSPQGLVEVRVAAVARLVAAVAAAARALRPLEGLVHGGLRELPDRGEGFRFAERSRDLLFFDDVHALVDAGDENHQEE